MIQLLGARTAILMALLVIATTSATRGAGQDGSNTDRVPPSYASANGLLNRGLHDLAAVEYRRFLADQPRHALAPMARYGLAVCLVRMQQHEEATRELKRLTEAADFEYAVEVATLLGQCHLAMGQPKRAAEALLRVVERHPHHALAEEAAALCVEALHRAQRFDAAVKLCETFDRSWPTSSLRDRVDYFGALALIAQDDHAAAAGRLERLLEQHPAGPFADHGRLLIAQCYQQQAALDAAAGCYQQVLDRNDSRYTGEALLGLAAVRYSRGELNEAERLLRKLLTQTPPEDQAQWGRFQLGRVLYDQNRFAAALALFDEVHATEGDLSAEASYWAARCLLEMEQVSDALSRLAKAIQAHPDSALAAQMRYDRIVALMRLDQHEAAARACVAFREHHADHVLLADVSYLAAMIAHQRDQYDDCEGRCAEFLQQYAAHERAVDVALLRADNAYRAGRYEDAISLYSKLNGALPDDRRARHVTYRIGMALYRLQRYDAAMACLQELSAAEFNDPEFRYARLALGDIRYHRGEWKLAETHLSAYLATGLDAPGADDALLKLGIALQRQNRPEDALQAFDKLLTAFAKSDRRWHALFERGQALMALDRHAEAEAAFNQLLKDEQADTQLRAHAHHLCGAIATGQRRYIESIEHYARAAALSTDAALRVEADYQHAQGLLLAERYEDAERALRSFVRAHGDHERAGVAWIQLGLSQARQQRYETALKTFAEAERIALPGVESPDSPLRIAAQMEKAWCLREVGRTAEAIAAYRALLDTTGPTLHVPAALELAELEAEARRHAEAARLLRQIRTRAAREPDAVAPDVLERATYRLGTCCFELGDTKQAASLLTELLERFPQSTLSASAEFFCGEALHREGKLRAAAGHFARVVERHPDADLLGPALLRLGETTAELQQWARSEAAFSNYLDHDPAGEQWFRARFGVGWARENQGRHPEAIRAYGDVVARHNGPTAARAQFQIGECLFAQKEYEAAVRELLKVDILYAYPEWSAAALYEAGRCFEALGKTVEARRQFTKVAEEHEGTHWAGLATQRLAALASGLRFGKG